MKMKMKTKDLVEFSRKNVRGKQRGKQSGKTERKKTKKKEKSVHTENKRGPKRTEPTAVKLVHDRLYRTRISLAVNSQSFNSQSCFDTR